MSNKHRNKYTRNRNRITADDMVNMGCGFVLILVAALVLAGANAMQMGVL